MAVAEAGTRRTIYYRYASGDNIPLLSMFDAANVTECYRRHETIVPQQALALTNSGMVLTRAGEIAAVIDREVGGGRLGASRLRGLGLRAHSRPGADRGRASRVRGGPRPAGRGVRVGEARTPSLAGGPSPRGARARAPEPQRFCLDPMNRAIAMDEHPADCACSSRTRRAFLADAGMGFVGLALGAMLHRDGVVRADAGRRLGAAGREAAFPAASEAGHLADDARRRQPPRELRPQARIDQARRQDDQREPAQAGGLRLALSQERPRAGREQHHRQDEGEDLSARRSASRRAVRAESRSATGGRTCAGASTTSP